MTVGSPGGGHDAPASRPVHLRASSLGLVLLGGVLGTAGREAVGLVVPPAGGVPWATLTVNLLGAFLLGLLLDSLARGGPDVGARRHLRLLLGTGLLGGFTTYSALAVDTAALLEAGRAGTATGYALGTVLVGLATTTAGVLTASALHRSTRGGGTG